MAGEWVNRDVSCPWPCYLELVGLMWNANGAVGGEKNGAVRAVCYGCY